MLSRSWKGLLGNSERGKGNEGVILCQPQCPLTMTPRNAKEDETKLSVCNSGLYLSIYYTFCIDAYSRTIFSPANLNYVLSTVEKRGSYKWKGFILVDRQNAYYSSDCFRYVCQIKVIFNGHVKTKIFLK